MRLLYSRWQLLALPHLRVRLAWLASTGPRQADGARDILRHGDRADR